MNLKFRIHSVSSQNPEHPASDLLSDKTDDNRDENRSALKFWQSAITPKYPQQITIQFYVPVRTKNLQLVFHPYKIPQKIEVFVKATKKQKYQKLGFIVPNDNLQSNFLQKQKKTLFFEYPCTFVKLILHKNYRNNRNLFDQVAIWDLKVEGQCLHVKELEGLDYDFLEALDTDEEENQSTSQNISASRSIPTNIGKQQKNQQAITSSLFPEVFKLLENAKAQAVEKQEFQKASQLKKTMNNFKQIQIQIQHLEQQKRKALQDEDYDRCQRLKNQILKKKDQATFQIKEIQEHYIQNMSEAHSRLIPQSFYPPIPENNYLTNRKNKEQYEDTPNSPVPNRSRYNNRASGASNVEDSYYDKYQSQVVPALQKKIEEQFNSVSKVNQSINENADNLSYYNNQGTNRRNLTEQSRNVVNNNNAKEIQEYAEESIDIRNFGIQEMVQQYPKLQPLDSKSIKKYEQYFNYIEPDLWRMALSQKFWKLKGYALDKVFQFQIQQGFHIQAMLAIIAIVIEDTHPVNVKKCLLLLQRLINIENKDYFDFQQSNSTKYCVEIILGNLLHLLTDTKEQFRKLADQIYKNLPDFSIVPLQQSIKFIVKENYSINNTSALVNKGKRKYTPKHLLAIINLIEYFVITYHDSQIFFHDIIKWAVLKLEDPDSNVKSAGTKLLLQICLRQKQYFIKIKDQILKKKSRKQICQNFQAYYENMIQSLEQQEKSKTQNQSEKFDTENDDDIYKKQTVMKKPKRTAKDQQISYADPLNQLNKMQESPIQSPNRLRESGDVELAYSQQSLFHQNSYQSHEWFAQKGEKSEDKYGDIHVMEPFDNQLEGMCDYCFQKIDENIDLHEHLLQYCPALVACLFCNSQIYFRQLNDHWVSECPKKCHQQCPRCLVAFQIDEINEHIARKICRKVNPKSGIEICPLCYIDVQGDDLAWVDHAQICQGVKQIKMKMKDKSSRLADGQSINSN